MYFPAVAPLCLLVPTCARRSDPTCSAMPFGRHVELPPTASRISQLLRRRQMSRASSLGSVHIRPSTPRTPKKLTGLSAAALRPRSAWDSREDDLGGSARSSKPEAKSRRRPRAVPPPPYFDRPLYSLLPPVQRVGSSAWCPDDYAAHARTAPFHCYGRDEESSMGIVVHSGRIRMTSNACRYCTCRRIPLQTRPLG